MLKYSVENTAGSHITLSKQLLLESLVKTGKEPRCKATGGGRLVLDRDTGLLRESELKFKSTLNKPAITTRTTITLKIKQLEGDELLAAMKAVEQATVRPERSKLNAADLREIMQELQSADRSESWGAASKLQTAELTEFPPGFLELMVKLAEETDSSLQNAAVRVLVDYGTSEQVPVLIRLMKTYDTSISSTVVRGLGRLQDERAIEPLVDMVARGGHYDSQAVTVLTRMGPAAEQPVLRLLDQKHLETRRSVCDILKVIGTGKSIEALKELAIDPDRMLSQAATEAVRAIMLREQ